MSSCLLSYLSTTQSARQRLLVRWNLLFHSVQELKSCPMAASSLVLQVENSWLGYVFKAGGHYKIYGSRIENLLFDNWRRQDWDFCLSLTFDEVKFIYLLKRDLSWQFSSLFFCRSSYMRWIQSPKQKKIPTCPTIFFEVVGTPLQEWLEPPKNTTVPEGRDAVLACRVKNKVGLIGDSLQSM